MKVPGELRALGVGGDTGIQLPPGGGGSGRRWAQWSAALNPRPSGCWPSLPPGAPSLSHLMCPHMECLLSPWSGTTILLMSKAHVPWAGRPLGHQSEGPRSSSRQL